MSPRTAEVLLEIMTIVRQQVVLPAWLRGIEHEDNELKAAGEWALLALGRVMDWLDEAANPEWYAAIRKLSPNAEAREGS